jgi:hypothetical protein
MCIAVRRPSTPRTTKESSFARRATRRRRTLRTMVSLILSPISRISVLTDSSPYLDLLTRSLPLRLLPPLQPNFSYHLLGPSADSSLNVEADSPALQPQQMSRCPRGRSSERVSPPTFAFLFAPRLPLPRRCLFVFAALPSRSTTATGPQLSDGTGNELIPRFDSLELVRTSLCAVPPSSTDVLSSRLVHFSPDFCLDAGSSPGNEVKMKIWQCYDGIPAQAWYGESTSVVDAPQFPRSFFPSPPSFCIDLSLRSGALIQPLTTPASQ